MLCSLCRSVHRQYQTARCGFSCCSLFICMVLRSLCIPGWLSFRTGLVFLAWRVSALFLAPVGSSLSSRFRCYSECLSILLPFLFAWCFVACALVQERMHGALQPMHMVRQAVTNRLVFFSLGAMLDSLCFPGWFILSCMVCLSLCNSALV